MFDKKVFFVFSLVVASATLLQGASAPVCKMGADPVDPTYQWVPEATWRLIKVAPGQEVTMTSGNGKEVTCTLPGGQVIAYPPDGGDPLVVLCKNKITKGRPTGMQFPRGIVEKEVIKYLPTPPPPTVAKGDPEPQGPTGPQGTPQTALAPTAGSPNLTGATVGSSCSAEQELELVRQLQKKGRKKNFSSGVCKTRWEEFKPATGSPVVFGPNGAYTNGAWPGTVSGYSVAPATYGGGSYYGGTPPVGGVQGAQYDSGTRSTYSH